MPFAQVIPFAAAEGGPERLEARERRMFAHVRSCVVTQTGAAFRVVLVANDDGVDRRWVENLAFLLRGRLFGWTYGTVEGVMEISDGYELLLRPSKAVPDEVLKNLPPRGALAVWSGGVCKVFSPP